MKLRYFLFAASLILTGLSACTDEDKPNFPEPPTYDMTGFAKGADVSWVTQMEKSGSKFYNANGRETECLSLLRELGMNSVRLRVWVDPLDGWCNKSDVLAKAWRAHSLGMRIMVDFHYSDSWADPGQQTKPAAWTDDSFEDLKVDVANHTREVLQALKDNGITPEWVQVGNETSNGMLWDDGKASTSMKNYTELNNSGYDAVKDIFSNAKVIVHLPNGYDNSLYRWLFDGLKSNGRKWDVIGMSLYPTSENWSSLNSQCIDNMKDMISRYGKEVMVCEVGMPWDEAEACKSFLTDLIAQSKAIEGNQCLGVFYWEPQASPGWNGYTLGAFDTKGKPTVALDAFN